MAICTMPPTRCSGWQLAKGLSLAPAVAAAGLAALVSLAHAGGADDWPSFRGGPQLTGVAATLPRELKLLWTYVEESGIESTVAIVDTTVYVTSTSGNLAALDLSSGARRWQYSTESEIKSSPTVMGGVVYFGDEGGSFHAVDTAAGQSRWVVRVGGPISSSANVNGDRLYFGSYDNALYCLSAADGAVAWKSETDGYIHGTPAIWKEAVAFAGCDGILRILDADDGSPLRKVVVGDYVAASLAIQDNRGYVGTFGNQVLGIDLSAGVVAWRFSDPDRTFPFYASPALRDTVLVVAGRDKTVRALHTVSGRPRWTYAVGSRVDSSPVIGGNRVFFGTEGGEVIALDLFSGAPVWRFSTGAAVVASPALGAGRLLIGATDGRLYCFGPVPPTAD